VWLFLYKFGPDFYLIKTTAGRSDPDSTLALPISHRTNLVQFTPSLSLVTDRLTLST